MKLYLFPPSGRVLGIAALKNHLAIDCEVRHINLGCGDQLAPQYVALNPNAPELRVLDHPKASGDGLALPGNARPSGCGIVGEPQR